MTKSRGFVNPNVKKSIKTSAGIAYYLRTEIEDSLGRWNDNYYMEDGYYVIHEGNQHHVYKVPPKRKEQGGFRIKFSKNMAFHLPEPKETFPTKKLAERYGIQKYGSGTYMEFGNGIIGGWAVVGKDDKHKFNPEGFGSWTDKGKGWHESPDYTGKARVHKEVAKRAQAKHAQNKPMNKMKCIKCKTNEAMEGATMCLRCAQSCLKASIGLSEAELREHKKDMEAEAKSS